MRRQIESEDILVDDLGYVQQDRAEMGVLFALLADRYERGSAWLTSNLPFAKWEAIFKDPMTTAAAIDRLGHHSVIVELNLAATVWSMPRRQKKRHKRRGVSGASVAPRGSRSMKEPAVGPGAAER